MEHFIGFLVFFFFLHGNVYSWANAELHTVEVLGSLIERQPF